MPVWRTVPKLDPFWLAGIAPPEIIRRETARAVAGLHTLPAHHPLTQRLRTPPLRGWFHLYSLTESQAPRDENTPEETWLAPDSAAPPRRWKMWTLPSEADPELHWLTHRPACLADLPCGIATTHTSACPEYTSHDGLANARATGTSTPTTPDSTTRPRPTSDAPHAFGTSHATFLARLRALKDEGLTGVTTTADGRLLGTRAPLPEPDDTDDEAFPIIPPSPS
ncbi:hypothetical protein B0H65DRAFT_578833 [Neurospora tetraspora]|uniref:Uncharacterized protein n=1 Tax=Neurospora tetraspora TaxID=94610 RepID=A0AAE0MR37_9PEZI|nr:hypothetical protein B0H65DRAFT_578833 [Neurospora tetraspora]